MTSIIFHNAKIRLGFHIPSLDTLHGTFEKAIEYSLMKDINLKAFQIYIAEKPWITPKFKVEDIIRTKELLEKYHKYACIHGSLFYNLAGCVNGKRDINFHRNLSNTINGLTNELDIAAGFDAGVVVHIGAAKNKKEGLFSICRTIEAVLEKQSKLTKEISKGLGIKPNELIKKRKIILENAAGEGNKIGNTLQEIADIISGVKLELRKQVKVCIDTAHIFGAGQYDFGNPDSVDSFYNDFDNLIGIDKLEVFHLNDSRVKFGSKKDRHENLGVGYIFGVERSKEDGDGLDGLKRFIEKAEEHLIPLIGEPPDKNAQGGPAFNIVWDYNVVKHNCNLEEEKFCC